jgi:hypothetical protein
MQKVKGYVHSIELVKTNEKFDVKELNGFFEDICRELIMGTLGLVQSVG